MVPLSFYFALVKANPILQFIITAIAMLGLISLMTKSTDQLSISLGPVAGGLLNATFGNFPELLIGINAIQAGMHVLIKGSLVGSIIGNILLTVGLAMFLGGLRYKKEKFSQAGANVSILMLVVALVALVIPSFVNYGGLNSAINKAAVVFDVSRISFCAAILLFIVYILYLIFSLKTHADEYSLGGNPSEKAVWSKFLAALILLAAAVLVAYESGIFVDAIQGMIVSKKVIFSELFMGVIFVAAIGNAAGVGVSVNMARKNKMDLAFQVSMGASIQVALLVVPLLVFYSFLIGKPFTLVFGGLEVISLGACALISGYSLLDGESNWFEGAMFIIIYLLVAVAFFFYK